MNFYVPELGDELVLTKDWKFNLFPEWRNTDLATLQNHYLYNGYDQIRDTWYIGWIDGTVILKMRDIDYAFEYPDREKFTKKSLGQFVVGSTGTVDMAAYLKACEEIRNSNPEYIQWEKDKKEWNQKCSNSWKPILPAVIPAGTTIKVDRIYIRKGAKDFSSITFLVRGLGEIEKKIPYPVKGKKTTKNKKSLRFWAKLVDCNTIEFEPKST